MLMKVVSLKNIVKLREFYKRKKISTVLAHGVFDVLHVGHILYFKEAKKNNKKLIVSITSDKFVNKGEGRPIFNIQERIKILGAIDCIDHIIISNDYSAVNIIKTLKPNYYIKGKDYIDDKLDLSKNLNSEISAVKSINGKFINSKSQLYSSSKIIGKYNENHKDENIDKFLEKNINLENLKYKIIKNFSKINKKEKILCIGDPIIDTYQYVETLGKSAKSNILSSKKISEKSYGGGIFLVMNYLSNFIEKIDYLAYTNLENEKKFKKYLSKNINLIKIKSKDIKIVNKTRFVDNYSKNKLFQVNENEYSKENKDQKKSKKFKSIISKYDKILIFDFGHGHINANLVKEINKHKNKCYINCQSNSSNFGFNLVNKYKSANSISVDELEFRLSTKNRYDEIRNIIDTNKKLVSKFTNFIVTQGKNGCYINNNSELHYIPTLIKQPSDSTGCGDIFFATFLLTKIYKNFSIKESGIISHMAAGLHTRKEGNENIITQNILCNFAKTYLN
jgi:rfaE bifunctional protein nucleotidyltransferase chain/domain